MLSLSTDAKQRLSSNFFHNAHWRDKTLVQQLPITFNAVLSIHERVINFVQQDKAEVVSLAHPFIYKGPYTLGVSAYTFNQVAKRLKQGNFITGELGKSKLLLKYHDATEHCILHRRARMFSFYIGDWLPSANEANHTVDINTIKNNLIQTRETIKKHFDLDSRILFANQPAFTNNRQKTYIQAQIKEFFPQLVETILNSPDPRCEKNWETTAQQLIGLGRGTTPSGDDMIHGCFLALNWLKLLGYTPYVDIPRISSHFHDLIKQKTTTMGIHMLMIGSSGLTPGPVIDHLSLISSTHKPQFYSNHKDSIYHSLLQLSKIGHTTGLDVITGFTYTALMGLSDS